MIPTDRFNERIREFLERESVHVDWQSERVLADRGSMLAHAPGGLEPEECCEWWLARLRQRFPGYVHLAMRGDEDWMEIVVAVEYEPDIGTCDVCRLPVAEHEDATHFSAILNGEPATPFLCGKRHIRCSPSRAQYIVAPEFGAPVVDDRPDFDKRLLDVRERRQRETLYTAAWQQLQKECQHEPADH